MRANPHRAERVVTIDGEERVIRYPLGAVLQFEMALDQLAEEFGVSADALPGAAQAIVLLWAGRLHEEPELSLDEVFGWEVDVGAARTACLEAWRAAGGAAGDNGDERPTTATSGKTSKGSPRGSDGEPIESGASPSPS